jgi:hypothetical protein
MISKKNILFLLCLGVVVEIWWYYHTKKENMQIPQQASEWLTTIKKSFASHKAGHFTASDKTGASVDLEWTMTDVRSPDFSVLMKNVCDVIVQAFTPVEVGFLKAHLESHGSYCASFDPLFSNGPIATDWQQFKLALKQSDWKTVEKKMPTVLQGIQLMDYSNFGVENVHCFVTVKNTATRTLLGYVIFYITPATLYGDVQVAGIGISPTEQNHGLGKLLISSIFKIVPNISSISLSTRPTNNQALHAYHHWGFVADSNPIPEPGMPINKNDWIYLIYNAAQTTTLQKTADHLKSNK